MMLVVVGCGQKAPSAKEVLPPKINIVEINKVKQTEFNADSYLGMLSGIRAENDIKLQAVAEAITTAINPIIDAVDAKKSVPDAIVDAAMDAATKKGIGLGLERAQCEGLAKASASIAINALASSPQAAKDAAAKASAGISKGMAEVNTVIAVSMSAAQARSVTVELAVEIENPNNFQIEVGYQWYYISVDGREIGKIMYPEKTYIPANTTITVQHLNCICLLDDIIVISLQPPMALPIHGAIVQPSAPGTGAIETGMAIWSKIRIPYEAEKTQSVDSWNNEVGMKTAHMTADQISQYIGAVYLGGKYISGIGFDKAYQTASTVTWDVKCELGIKSEYGSLTEKPELSWTAGKR